MTAVSPSKASEFPKVSFGFPSDGSSLVTSTQVVPLYLKIYAAPANSEKPPSVSYRKTLPCGTKDEVAWIIAVNGDRPAEPVAVSAVGAVQLSLLIASLRLLLQALEHNRVDLAIEGRVQRARPLGVGRLDIVQTSRWTTSCAWA
jgi:hypothetical protein